MQLVLVCWHVVCACVALCAVGPGARTEVDRHFLWPVSVLYTVSRPAGLRSLAKRVVPARATWNDSKGRSSSFEVFGAERTGE